MMSDGDIRRWPLADHAEEFPGRISGLDDTIGVLPHRISDA